MSLSKTFLVESKIEHELEQFFNYVVEKMNLDRSQFAQCMRDYKLKDISKDNCDTTSSNCNDGVCLIDDKEPFIVITKFGERYKTTCKDLSKITNPQLLKLLQNQSISQMEYSTLKTFLKSTNITFQDVVNVPRPVSPKITDIESIVNKVKREIESPPKSTLKLVKVGAQLAWDKDSKFVFRLSKDIDGKTIPIAFAKRLLKTDENIEFSPEDIKDLETRGWKFDVQYSKV